MAGSGQQRNLLLALSEYFDTLESRDPRDRCVLTARTQVRRAHGGRGGGASTARGPIGTSSFVGSFGGVQNRSHRLKALTHSDQQPRIVGHSGSRILAAAREQWVVDLLGRG